MTTIGDFDDALLERLFRHLTDARDRERAGCVSKQWLKASRQEHDDAWESICRRELHLRRARGPARAPVSGYREAYIAWVQHFEGLDLEQAFFAARFWADIEAWAEAHLPSLLDTLSDGLPREVVTQAADAYTTTLPDVLVALYTIHNGQEELDPPERIGFHPGLFGCDPNYNAQVGMLPLDAALRFGTALECPYAAQAQAAQAAGRVAAEQCQAIVPRQPGGKVLLAACTADPRIVHNAKYVLYNAKSDEVLSACGHECAHSLVSEGAAATVAGLPQRGPQELCAWLQTYVTRLQKGVYVVSRWRARNQLIYESPLIEASQLPFIDTFPQTSCVEAVTRGVRIRALAMPLVTHTGAHVRRGVPERLLKYNIEFSHVVPEGGVIEPGMVAQAQLRSRHWRGTRPGVGGKQVETWTVDGEAVVGAYPIVKPGPEGVSNYSSQGGGLLGDSLTGWFRFVPGSIAEPTGPDFDVACPKLTWADDGFLY